MDVKGALAHLQHLVNGGNGSSEEHDKDVEALRVLNQAYRDQLPLKKFDQINVLNKKIVERFFLPRDPKCPHKYFMGMARLSDPYGAYEKMSIGERSNFSGQTVLVRVS